VSPDGRLLTYLQPEATNQTKLDLWAAPIEGGAARLSVSGQAVDPDAAKLSEAEKGQRERQRLAAVSGVIDYAFDDQGAPDPDPGRRGPLSRRSPDAPDRGQKTADHVRR